MPEGDLPQETSEEVTYIEKVKKACDDTEWQEFRKSLKGTTTETKLKLLCEYYIDNIDPRTHAGIEPCGLECDVCLRVDNYLKALCRGGQLYAGTDLDQAFEKQFIYLPYKK